MSAREFVHLELKFRKQVVVGILHQSVGSYFIYLLFGHSKLVFYKFGIKKLKQIQKESISDNSKIDQL